MLPLQNVFNNRYEAFIDFPRKSGENILLSQLDERCNIFSVGVTTVKVFYKSCYTLN